MGNCSQINNTTILGTSAVTYDGTKLPCTDVNTCDGLNTILSKFDAIICDVKSNVDILTEEIIDITEDIMIITEDIININNQLEICCPICDFTGTADELPLCDFTGEADQLPDPTTTTTSSSTSTSTSTTTSTSTSTSTSTTTTSTTLPPTTTTTTSFIPPPLCNSVEVYPPIFNPGTYHVVDYIDCAGVFQELIIPDGGRMVTICVQSIVADNNNGITNPLFTLCSI
jgi:hypothetical protein